MSESLDLGVKDVLDLFPVAPFNFDATVHKPDHFPSADNEWVPGTRWQTMRWRGRPLGLKLENRGTVDQPRISLSVWSRERLGPTFLGTLADEITYRCNLKLDLTEFYASFQDDPLLGPAIDRWRGMRPMSCTSLYEYLIIAIVLQNATVRRSVGMLQALFQAYGVLLRYDEKELYGFWEPEAVDQVSELELRDLKLGYRAKSIQRITRAFAARGMDELSLRSRPKEEQRQALLGLYGIGPASAWYILFDIFHHWDELNHISPWEQKIYSKLFFDAEPNDPVPVGSLLSYLGERFGPYRMLAVHYLWEDLFWRRKTEEVPWLDKLIRLA